MSDFDSKTEQLVLLPDPAFQTPETCIFMTLLQRMACITVARIRGFWFTGLDPLLLLLRRMSGSSDTNWAQQDSRRVLLVDFRVQNIEHAQQFYEQHLGMRLWRRLGDLQQGQFSSVCGYGKADNGWHQLLHTLSVEIWLLRRV